MKNAVGLLEYGLSVFQFPRNRAFLTDEECTNVSSNTYSKCGK